MKNFTTGLLILGITSSALAQTKNEDFHIDKEYKVQPNGTIYLNASDAKVSIIGSARKTAHVRIDREVSTKGLVFGEEEFRVDVEEDNGNLSIKEHSRSTNVGIIGYHYEKYTIALEIPDGASLKVRGDDGDYLIKSVNGAIDVTLDDGDIELIGCRGDNFKFQIDDGDIKMDEGRGSLDVDADDADITIEKGNFTKIYANMDDGDFIVQTSLTNDGEYFIDAQDGLVSLTVLSGGGKFDIRHDDARVITEGSFSMVEESENRTRLTLPSGSAKVDIRGDDARVRLTSK
jgi:DUF4097 and DUF4098 domain-containing protein YvlB